MRKVLTAEQMREVDRLTTERYGIPSVILMENAAHAVARVITEKVGGSVEGKSVLILCGKGNNGGDGAALARILWQQKADVCVVLIGNAGETEGDARTQFDILRSLSEAGTPFLDFWELPDGILHPLKESLVRSGVDLLVDAMVGTGLNRPLSQAFQLASATAWQWTINMRRAPILSVDVPTGVRTDNAIPTGRFIRADWTVTFTSPKPVNVIPPASDFGGELIIKQIGSPEDLVDEQPSQLYLTTGEDASLWLAQSQFQNASYKNKRGHALIVAGSENYSGAAAMCGNAAMRSGVGLTTICVPESVKAEVVSRSIPEIIVRAIEENEDGEVASNAFEKNAEAFDSADAIAVGCGLSATDGGVKRLVRKIVDHRKVPVIIDAGALWFCNPDEDLLQKPARSKGTDDKESALKSTRAPLILTPHEGEFLRLLGTEDKEAIKDRVAAVRDFATTNKVILVLKGERVLIGEPGGKVVVNPTGNSGLGKAGNGDTLAGILAGFVAQGTKMNIDIFETVVAAVYVAGMAGDVAEKKFGKRVMTASDVRECLVDVFAELSEEK